MLQFLEFPRGDQALAESGYMRRVDFLAEGLRARGCQVDRVHLPELKVPRRLALAKLLAWRQVRRVAADYDAIHAANALVASIAALAVRGTKTKLIFDVHGDVASESWLIWKHTHSCKCISTALQLSVADWIARRGADGFLVVSKPSRELYIRRGVPADRLLIARNGADLDLFTKQPLRGDDGIIRICYSGGFAAWQGIGNLLQACEILCGRGWPDRLRLRMIGFAPSTVGVRERFSQVLGERFEPADRVRRAELPVLFAESDLMVIPRTPHPAVAVAMPTKFGEYAAAGRGIIVVDVDETADLVRASGCGIVAGPGPAGLADAMAQAAVTPYGRIAEMGARGRELAEREFSSDAIAARYHRFLQRIVVGASNHGATG